MGLFEDTFPPYVPFGSRNLHLTSPTLRGTDVAVLQAIYDLMLDTMNPPQGPMGSPVPITGEFDSATRTAVVNIQDYFGLAVDGVVGPQTFFAFGQGVGSLTTYGGPVYGSRSLTPGDRGGDVTILQNRLNTFRYASIIGHPANGVYDAATASAVLAFKQDAIANGQTGLSMNTTVGDGTFDASWLYTFAGGRGILPGRNGFDVAFLQVLLTNLSDYSGRITGYYDAATQAAVRAFQHRECITVDGRVGPVTFYRLGRHNQQAAPKPLAVAWPPSEPPAGFRDCCMVMQPQVPAQPPFTSPPGGTAWVRQFDRGSLEFAMILMNLPEPSTFDPSYNAWVLEFEAFPLRALSEFEASPGVVTYWRSQSYGSPVPASATVTIRPGTSQPPEPLGPVVLSASFSTCRS